MATLQFTVWKGAGAVAQGPVVNEDIITISSTSAQSSGVVDPAGGNKTRFVRIMADGDCWVTWGADPTALDDGTEGRMMGAENPEYWWITADQKIAVIERA